MAGQNSNGDEAAHKEKVEKDGQEGEEHDAAEKEGQDESEESVKHSGSRDSLNRFRVGRDMHVVTGQIGEEVGEDAET